MKLILTFLLAFSSIYLSAQVYANDALRIQAEKDAQKKTKTSNTNKSVVGTIEKKIEKPIDKNTWNNSYFLTSIEAIDHSDKHTAEEMKTYNDESIVEFDKTEIRISDNFDLIFFKSKIDESQYSSKEIYIDGSTIKYLDCEKCDNFSFVIIQKTSNYLVLETESQDEGTYYTTRLILKK